MSTSTESAVASPVSPFVVRVPVEHLTNAVPGTVEANVTQLGPAHDLFTFEVVHFGDVLLSRITDGADTAGVIIGRPDIVTTGGVIRSGSSVGRREGEADDRPARGVGIQPSAGRSQRLRFRWP